MPHTSLPLHIRRARILLASTAGLLGLACSSETSSPGGDATDALSTTTSSMTSGPTALPTASPNPPSPSSSTLPTSTLPTSPAVPPTSVTPPPVTPTTPATTTTSPTTNDDVSSATSSEPSLTSSEDPATTEASGQDTSSSGGSEPATSGGEDSSESSSPLSSGCGKPPTLASNTYNNGNPIAITAANRQRRYILSVPSDYDNTKPYNLVIAWHQLDGNDKQMYQQNYYWLKDIPEAASSTIFVAPNGEKNNTPCTGTGNGESGCGWPDSSGSNVALADAVVAQIEENFCIDKNRIFANGWSYGGSMSYRTACSRPLGGTESDWGVRAVAVYNGAAQLSSGGCTPSKKVAFYASHGTDDNVLGYDGGVSMANSYATLNGCTWMTPTKATGNHVCTNVAGCMTGYPVEFCSFVGPHTPDPQEGGQRWQPKEVWKFFSQL